MVTLPTASVIVSVITSSEPDPDLIQYICESSTVAVPDDGQVFVSVTSQLVPNMFQPTAWIDWHRFLIRRF